MEPQWLDRVIRALDLLFRALKLVISVQGLHFFFDLYFLSPLWRLANSGEKSQTKSFYFNMTLYVTYRWGWLHMRFHIILFSFFNFSWVFFINMFEPVFIVTVGGQLSWGRSGIFVRYCCLSFKVWRRQWQRSRIHMLQQQSDFRLKLLSRVYVAEKLWTFCVHYKLNVFIKSCARLKIQYLNLLTSLESASPWTCS